MTGVAGLLAALAALVTGPEFADPVAKGMPFPIDRPVIPAAYHGRWAPDLASCRRKAKVLVISARQLAGQQVIAVNGYSDHPAIFVRLRHARNRGLGIGLDISLDQQWLRRSDGFGSEPVLLQRCPR